MSRPGRLYILLSPLLLLVTFSRITHASEGYDLNTEITVSGTITKMLGERRGPVTYLLESEDRLFKIITGPWWYLREIELQLRENMNVPTNDDGSWIIAGSRHSIKTPIAMVIILIISWIFFE